MPELILYRCINVVAIPVRAVVGAEYITVVASEYRYTLRVGIHNDRNNNIYDKDYRRLPVYYTVSYTRTVRQLVAVQVSIGNSNIQV